MGAETVNRFTDAGHGDALETLLEVLEQEADDRRQRRIGRLRRESRLPAGKTWETFEHDRVPLALQKQLGELAGGSFAERGVNVLGFGLPSTGKTHALCAVTGWWSRADRCSSLRHTGWCRTCWPPSGTSRCRDNYGSSTTSTSCCWTTWATCPREPRSPKCSSPSSRNATSAAPWASHPTWSSPSGSTSSPIPWPPPRP